MTKTNGGKFTGGIIPLFKLLIGSTAEYNNTRTVTEDSSVLLRAGGIQISSGVRCHQFWATQISRDRETRAKNSDSAVRNRTTEDLSGVVGGVNSTPRTYDPCLDMWSGGRCNPVEECPEEAVGTAE